MLTKEEIGEGVNALMSSLGRGRASVWRLSCLSVYTGCVEHERGEGLMWMVPGARCVLQEQIIICTFCSDCSSPSKAELDEYDEVRELELDKLALCISDCFLFVMLAAYIAVVFGGARYLVERCVES